MTPKTLQEYLAIFRKHVKQYEAQYQGEEDGFNLPLAFVCMLEAILKLQGWHDP